MEEKREESIVKEVDAIINHINSFLDPIEEDLHEIEYKRKVTEFFQKELEPHVIEATKKAMYLFNLKEKKITIHIDL